jgi:hypothetical protein
MAIKILNSSEPELYSYGIERAGIDVEVMGSPIVKDGDNNSIILGYEILIKQGNKAVFRTFEAKEIIGYNNSIPTDSDCVIALLDIVKSLRIFTEKSIATDFRLIVKVEEPGIDYLMKQFLAARYG